jgi:tetratricopeptide (TPR) repeat protein
MERSIERKVNAIYTKKKSSSRITVKKAIAGSINAHKQCEKSGINLVENLNQWLKSPSFSDIRDALLVGIKPTDEVRFLIQADEPDLDKLPWHYWDLVKKHSSAEVALSFKTVHSCPNRVSLVKNHIRMLAIFGNSDGIDTSVDREILENFKSQFPNCVDLQIFSEPKPDEINDRLWEENWDIVFFAGHSITEENEGTIYLSEDVSLPITNLWYGLKRAVERGLQLAIFNSCDGLGLARRLDDTFIPQAIVMRDRIPDRVAHEFLRNFLTEFSGGKSLYLAVKIAREKLQVLENEYPCATWLPVIYQNLAEVPYNWPDFAQIRDESEIGPPDCNPSSSCFSRNSLSQLFFDGFCKFDRKTTILLFLSLIGMWSLRELSSFGLNRMGLYFLRKDRSDPKMAMSYFKLSLALKENNSSALNNLGFIYEDLGEQEKSKSYYKHSKNLGNWAGCNNEARLDINQGISYRDFQQIQKAEDLLLWSCLRFARTEKSKEGEYLVLKNIGWARIEQHNYKGAAEVLQQAIALRNDEGIAHCFLAEALQAQDREHQAVEEWRLCDEYGKNYSPEEIRLRKKAREILNKMD